MDIKIVIGKDCTFLTAVPRAENNKSLNNSPSLIITSVAAHHTLSY